MTQYNTLSIKLSNLQLNKLKSGIKSNAEVTLKISSNVIGDSNDENNFLHTFLLTNTEVLRLCKAFANSSSTNIELSKLGGFLCRLLGPLLKIGLLSIGNVIKPLAKSISIPLGLTAAASATDLAIHWRMFGSGFTTIIIYNEEMEYIMKIVKSLAESGLLIKGVRETIKNEAKEQKGGFLSILLGTLGASLLNNLLTGKGTIREGEGTIRADEKF